MFLRLLVSLFLLTALTSDGTYLPNQVYSYLTQACSTSFSSSDTSELAGRQTNNAGLFSDSFKKLTCSASLKRLPVREPVEGASAAGYFTGRQLDFTGYIVDTREFGRLTDEAILNSSDNSPPQI